MALLIDESTFLVFYNKLQADILVQNVLPARESRSRRGSVGENQ